MSSERRLAFARAAARLLRRRGPIPTTQLLALLSAEGLSATEALCVVNHGFTHQLLMRDPGDAGAIAAGTVSLPAPKRAVVMPVLTAPSSKRKPHRRKATATSSIDD